ncbi:hypothetical protein CKO09_11700 [Chromatium weissei]|nr:hypothetical protein [Chromatium weissei]
MFRLNWCWILLFCSVNAWSWEEEKVIEYITAYHPILRAQRVVTTEYTPPSSIGSRLKEYTALYGRAGAGGTDYLSGESQPLVLQAGVQITIPLTSTKERRDHALKAVEEMRSMDEIQGKIITAMGELRNQESELTASETRLKFYSEKSEWMQKRVSDGFSDVESLWTLGQKLNDERANAEKLRIQTRSVRYQLAHQAGNQWRELLRYLEGKGGLQ